MSITLSNVENALTTINLISNGPKFWLMSKVYYGAKNLFFGSPQSRMESLIVHQAQTIERIQRDMDELRFNILHSDHGVHVPLENVQSVLIEDYFTMKECSTSAEELNKTVEFAIVTFLF